MKLIGSKTETEFRDSLIISHNHYLSSDSDLKSYLRTQNIPFGNAYILNVIPDQTSDYFLILISGSKVITVEIDKYDTSNNNIQNSIEFKQYLVGLSKGEQIKVFVAKELGGM